LISLTASNRESANSRIAIVLARGASKRIPGKNYRILGGKPLISWIIESISSSECFSKILVSTDSKRIAAIAKREKAWVPFFRPPNLSTDSATSLDALIHAVEWVIENGQIETPEVIGLFQPTSPFLSSKHIGEAIALFEEMNFTSMSSVCPVKERPEWMFHVTPSGEPAKTSPSGRLAGTPPSLGGRATPLHPDKLTLPTDILPKLYRENGALFLVKTKHLLSSRSLYHLKKHGSYIMPVSDSIDIDTPDDWLLAETIIGNREKIKK